MCFLHTYRYIYFFDALGNEEQKGMLPACTVEKYYGGYYLCTNMCIMYVCLNICMQYVVIKVGIASFSIINYNVHNMYNGGCWLWDCLTEELMVDGIASARYLCYMDGICLHHL